MGTDRIELRGLQLTGIVGVLPEERERPQPLEVDLDLHLDIATAAVTDGLDDTVDYGAVCDEVARIIASSQPLLLERLADQLAMEILDLDSRIELVTATVRKLRPPVPYALASSGVTVSRARR